MRRILIAVTGLSPQILTETIYALARPARAGEVAWIPDEILLITTRTGRETALLNLLAEPDGWFHRLHRDYNLPPIAFDASRIHTIHDAQRTALDDIRNRSDNRDAANAIVQLVRECTDDPKTELHVSIAGGRKTMGFYVGYALSLYGRPQDRMSHVLVSPQFEGQRDFYYPTPYDHAVHVRIGGREVAMNARDAQVDIADIPFVPLRTTLPEHLLGTALGYNETVQAIRDSRPETARLAYDIAQRCLLANDHKVRLSVTQLLVHMLVAAHMFAEPGNKTPAPLRAPLKDTADPGWVLAARARLAPFAAQDEALADLIDTVLGPVSNPKSLDGNWFSQHLSRLRRTLDQELGASAGLFRIERQRSPTGNCYTLRIAAANIDILSPNDATSHTTALPENSHRGWAMPESIGGSQHRRTTSRPT